MNCWEVLGIEPFSDKKTIKIAYAKLLKKHRPDEDPEGFQQLHAAYKNALQWTQVDYSPEETPWMTDEGKPIVSAESVWNYDPDPLVSETNSAETELTLKAQQYPDDAWPIEPEPPELTDEEKVLLAEINDQEDSLSEDWEILYDRVNEFVKVPKQANNLDSWRFIESLPSMRDLDFRKATSDKIFEVVAELNVTSLQRKNLYIQRPVINYLNSIFNWDKKWQVYEVQYTRKMLDAVFPYLAEAERPVKGISKRRELYYYRRGAAFAIDIVILFVIALLIDSLASSLGGEGGSNNVYIGWWLLFYVLLLIPLQESSIYQGTIGKRVMGLQVISSRGDRLNFFHALWRSVLTAFCCVAFKVVVFINIALSWWRSEILQDTLSRSYVMLKPGR